LDIIYNLASKCDVFLHNFVPEKEDQLRISYDIIKQHNPQIIYAGLTGYEEMQFINCKDMDLMVLMSTDLLMMFSLQELVASYLLLGLKTEILVK
jgi:crotonobetainyl-CoA:carnitine CoA-transferase CaiB-like acyl-CoA transferase